jgi:hypothetical protein
VHCELIGRRAVKWDIKVADDRPSRCNEKISGGGGDKVQRARVAALWAFYPPSGSVGGNVHRKDSITINPLGTEDYYSAMSDAYILSFRSLKILFSVSGLPLGEY